MFISNMEERVILFDGVCNLCNNTVQFVIKHDTGGKFKFAALQSDYAKETLKNQSLDSASLSSIVLIDEAKVYTKSTAALRIAKYLNNGLPFLYHLILLPKFLRDGVYDIIAKNRYKWFGQQENCMIPTPDLKNRFLD